MTEILPILAPDAARGRKTLARCHARLTAHRKALEAAEQPTPRIVAAERLLLAGTCLAYLVASAADLVKTLK